MRGLLIAESTWRLNETPMDVTPRSVRLRPVSKRGTAKADRDAMKKLDAVGIPRAAGLGRIAFETTETSPKKKLPSRSKLHKVLEKNINSGIRTILELDGWHVFMMETVSRAEWGKFTGEPGMPDILAIRYIVDSLLHSFNDLQAMSEVLWIEGKRPYGIVAGNQRIWHAVERKRGALVWVGGEDFEASVDGFLEKYKASGLCRREIL